MSLKKHLTLSLGSLLLSSMALAGPLESLSTLDKSSSSMICVDPLQTVCVDTQTQRQDRAQRIAALKNEIAAEANQTAAPRLEEMRRTIKPYRIFKRLVATIKIRNQEIMKAAQKRVGGIESAFINEANISRIKNYLYQSIDQSAYDQVTKNNFKTTIQSIIVGNFSDYIERTNLDDSVLAQVLGNACGSDGMVENAFATTLGKDRYVLICPGFLISLSETPTDSERFNSILQAISHEMAHHIDNSKVGNELYAPYLGCIADNYADTFKRTKDDDKFCQTSGTSLAACHQKVTQSHAGELVADAWGIRVLNLHMRAQAYSFEQADQLLTQSWINLCSTSDEGIHPSGDFRIGTSVRTNPEISKYLGCDNAPITKPACTLEGAVTLP